MIFINVGLAARLDAALLQGADLLRDRASGKNACLRIFWTGRCAAGCGVDNVSSVRLPGAACF
ncbi:MAG: hypothetical protein A3E79_09385 [Burkholderiales bacterium RIFCSPHIGHO2_12_FULL_61_11]|nr:MAG: hypothetical protein A3E79_09385 [Burkholderiales bacterium RIFCSPHIGHO2_12_FULL_61_11]